jgi:predicted DNA-binding transcriptional regulator AlpA
MTDEEKKRIIEFKKKRPTYNLDELSKKFGRSESTIWKLIKDL